MNINSLFIWGFSALILSGSSAESASILLDSFNSGGFALQAEGSTFNNHNLARPGFDIRDARGAGDFYWSASVDAQVGVFNYTVELRGTPGRFNFFIISYFKQELPGISLLGVDSLVLNIRGLTGLGELQAGFGTNPNFTGSLPILGTGNQSFAFTELFPTGWNESSTSFVIKFVPKSSDFSITLDEISLIPEPGGLALLAGAAGVWGLRRQRGGAATFSA